MAQKTFEELYKTLFKNRMHSLIIVGLTEEEIQAFRNLGTASLDDGDWTISEINQVYTEKYPILFVKSHEKLSKDLSRAKKC